jgi:DNA-binding NarL/FixJ family response regulator
MAVSRGKELLSQKNPDPDAVRKSIVALEQDAEHIRKCIKANLRDYDSGQGSIDEINDLIRQLKGKL